MQLKASTLQSGLPHPSVAGHPLPTLTLTLLSYHSTHDIESKKLAMYVLGFGYSNPHVRRKTWKLYLFVQNLVNYQNMCTISLTTRIRASARKAAAYNQ